VWNVSGYEHLPTQGNFVIATTPGIVDAPLAFYALDRWDLFVLVGEKWKEETLLQVAGQILQFHFHRPLQPGHQGLAYCHGADG